jgi:hypothetical protein
MHAPDSHRHASAAEECANNEHTAGALHAALSSEQLALLDFLVLARGRAFVGFGSSTFSFYLREYRALQGLPRGTSVLVDASIVGTDSLFYSAGVLT